MPRSIWLSIVVFVTAFWATVGQADTGWQPIQETIRKSEKDTRQYQAITLDNKMVVLLVSDPQAVKSLSALVVPVGSLEDPDSHPGLAHFLEHMTLMGSKNYPQPDSLAEFLKMPRRQPQCQYRAVSHRVLSGSRKRCLAGGGRPPGRRDCRAAAGKKIRRPRA